MSKEITCPREEIIAYDFGELTDKERAELEGHMKKCKACREYCAFIGSLKKAMKDLPEPEIGPCPSSEVLVRYVEGDLDDESKARVGVHILYCEDCFHEMLVAQEIQEALAAAAEKPSRRLVPSIPKVTKAIREMAELADAIGSNGREFQGARQLLQIGQLAYRQLVSSPYASHWEPLAKFTHGALNEALILLGEHKNSPEYAQACYALSLVCRYIARWTRDVEIAEKSLSLLKMALGRLSGEDLAALGLGRLSELQAEALIDQVRERARDETEGPGLVSAEAAVPVLNPVEMLMWLQATYGVKPRSKKGLWGRVEAFLRQGLPVPERFMRPRVMGAIGSGTPVRDEKKGEELAELQPGIRGELYWPIRDLFELVYLDLTIEDRRKLGLVPDKPVQIVLWANVLPPKLPERLQWANWIAGGRQYRAEIEADERRFEIPITQPCVSVNDEQKRIIRNWISQNLVIEPPRQEASD